MTLLSTLPRRIGAGPLSVVLVLLATVPAHSADNDQAKTLCSSPVPCSVQVSRLWAEGAAGEVVVTGRPGTTVTVQAFTVGRTAAGLELDGLGKVVDITTDGAGFGHTQLTLPSEGAPGGPVLIALADSRGPALDGVLGAWTTLATREPLLLGDGFAEAKPVGEPLAMHVTAAPAGASYHVEIERDGAWEPAGTTTSVCGDPAAVCEVTYVLPRGLRPSQHAVRIVERASGVPVGTWTVLPSADGEPSPREALPSQPSVGTALPGVVSTGSAQAVPRPRSQDLDVPEIGAGVEGAAVPRAGVDATAVRRVVIGFGALALLGALVGLARAGVRRRAVSGG